MSQAPPPPDAETSKEAAPENPPTRALWKRRLGSDWLVWPVVFGALYFLMRPGPSGPPSGSHLEVPPLVDVATGRRVELPKGKPVLVEVFASWCGACKRSNTMLGVLGTPELPYFMVSVDERVDDARSAVESWPIKGPVLFDAQSRVSRLWNIEVLPTFLLLDADGSVTRVSTGMPGALDLHAFSEAAKKRNSSSH